jgi:hypothetical protein
MRNRTLWSSLTPVVIGALVLAGAVASGSSLAAQTRGRGSAPTFQVDPLWPKPLPNHWILGSVTGVAVDARDHVWIVHRGLDSLTARTEAGLATTPPTAEGCCAVAPPVLEFDQAGNLVSSWGGPGQGYDWPVSPGGIAIDAQGNVWITAAGPPPVIAAGQGSGEELVGRGAPARGAAAPPAAGAGAAAAGAAGAGATGAGVTGAAGAGALGQRAGGGGQRGGRGGAPPRPTDAHVLKFSRSGQFLMQIGKPGMTEGSNTSTTTLNRPAGVTADGGDLFVADGFGNQRVVVFDGATGAYKRHWLANGEPFKNVACARVARDGQVYVCDRAGNRIQVFRRDGTFVREATLANATRGNGAVWDIAFSNDAAQQHLFVADGQNQTVHILQRGSLESIATIGAGGRWPGHFYGVGSVAVDSRGNLYTGETYEGKRVQKFVRR